MKVKCIHNYGLAQPEGSKKWIRVSDGLAGSLTIGKTYEVIEIENDFYRIIDDEGEDYLYPSKYFEIVETTLLERHLLDKL